MEAPRTEMDLVLAASRGEVEAFAALVARHRDRLVRSARAILRDPHSAEDAAQDALVTAYRSLASLRDPARFGAWLATILLRIALAAKRRPRLALLGPEPENAPARPPGGHPRLDALAREVSRLPDRYRLPLALHYLAELSYEDVGEALGIPVKRVKSRLYDARRMLRRRLGDEAD